MMGILIYFMISCSKIVLSLLHENESIYHFFFMSYSRQHSMSSYQVGCHNNYEYYAYGSPSHVDIENYYIVNSH